jgi:hypothetical protein
MNISMMSCEVLSRKLGSLQYIENLVEIGLVESTVFFVGMSEAFCKGYTHHTISSGMSSGARN